MNIILLSGIKIDKLWDIIKDYRSRYLIANIDVLKTNLFCFARDTEVLYSVETVNGIDQLKSIIDSFEIEVYPDLNTRILI